jgi:hypothetical protein
MEARHNNSGQTQQSPLRRLRETDTSQRDGRLTPETLTLEAGERGEIVLHPEGDSRDPRVTLEGSEDFVVEEVLLGNLPAPRVDTSSAQRGTWSARVSTEVRGVLTSPNLPLKVLVRNTGDSKITLRATIAEEPE